MLSFYLVVFNEYVTRDPSPIFYFSEKFAFGIFLVVVEVMTVKYARGKSIKWGEIAFVLLLTYTYMTNAFDLQNSAFGDFQSDSANLVKKTLTNVYEFQPSLHVNLHYGLTSSGNQVYESQVGLQGLVARGIALVVHNWVSIGELYRTFELGLCLLMAVVVVMIGIQIQKQYGKLMMWCFLGVFWLSPWIVNFARNPYWVEFTWFVPMLIGLICVNTNMSTVKIRYGLLVAAFLAILVKSLCGYEYITSVMMGLILFPVAEFIGACYKKNKAGTILWFKNIMALGVAALAGFGIAICIHALLRGNGDVLVGLNSIYKNDVLRRTLGGNPENFGAVYAESLQAGIMTTIKKYFAFNTQIIAGLDGNLFRILVIVSLMLVIKDIMTHRSGNERETTLYFFAFLMTISWFVLGKSHSYIHTHINFVLWYMGYIQMCFYTVCRHILLEIKGNVIMEERNLR